MFSPLRCPIFLIFFCKFDVFLGPMTCQTVSIIFFVSNRPAMFIALYIRADLGVTIGHNHLVIICLYHPYTLPYMGLTPRPFDPPKSLIGGGVLIGGGLFPIKKCL